MAGLFLHFHFFKCIPLHTTTYTIKGLFFNNVAALTFTQPVQPDKPERLSKFDFALLPGLLKDRR